MISINTLLGNFKYLEKRLYKLEDFDKLKCQENQNTNAEFKSQVLWK